MDTNIDLEESTGVGAQPDKKSLHYKEYIERHVEACKRTGKVTDDMIALNFDNPQGNTTMLMTILGMQTELAELADLVQKKVFYGIPMDVASVLEEMGDFKYYWDLLQDHLRKDLCCDAINDITIRDLNRKKLRVRFPEGRYDNNRAIEKNLEAERAVFEDLDTPYDF